jgi:quercetin dioxygenase-like cupin family protein
LVLDLLAMAHVEYDHTSGARSNAAEEEPQVKAAVFLVLVLLAGTNAHAQAVGGPERGRPVTGDPGISSMMVMDYPEFRVLRDWAEPNATRRMHSHNDATYHVFTLVTGQLQLTIEGEPPVDVLQGDVLYLEGGARHTFTNTGAVTATIVEVFGKQSPGGAPPATRSPTPAPTPGAGR